MHRFGFAVVAAMLAAGLPCLPADATGNVLVPSENDSSAGDLGYATETPESAQPAQKPDTESGVSTLPSLDSDSSHPPAPHYAPTPTASAPDLAKAATDAPQIIKLPSFPAQSAPGDSNLSENLAIQIADKYTWGSNDSVAVQNSLGIASDKVRDHCRLSASGMAHGTAASDIFIFDMGEDSKGFIQYDGKLTGASLQLRALCDPVPLPASARYVMQVGDKYSVYLASLDCPAPPDHARTLVVHYNGNGKGQCAYE